MSTPIDHDELIRRISRDLADGYDEELEMEIEDRHPLPGVSSAAEGDAEKAYRRDYFQQLFRLQAELVKLQDWVVASRQKVLILFEGRDAAGKGSDQAHQSKTQSARMQGRRTAGPQRSRAHAVVLPALHRRTFPPPVKSFCSTVVGTTVRASRQVMGFCTAEEYEEFFRSVPEFERMLVRSGIRLLKYWFSITDEEQYLRFLGRVHDPLKQWKLSPMDLESRRRWEAYTKAKEVMLERSHIPEARWWVVQAVDKKRARLNCIDHC